jgi:hypothetical protein
MRTFAIVMVGLLIVSAGAAFASPTRTHVMGNNDMIMVDDGNIFRFAGRINNYPDLAMGEFADYYDYYDYFWQLGITWKFGEERPWVLGTFVNTDPSTWPVSYDPTGVEQLPYWGSHSSPETVAAPATLDMDNYNPRRFQFIVGHELGGQKFGFSLEVVRISEKWDQDSVTTPVPQDLDKTEQSFSQFTFGLGLTEATTGKWDLGLSFMMGSWSDKDEEGDEVSKPSGYYELGVAGRYFMVKSPKITLVPHVSVGIGKRGAEYLWGDTVVANNTKDEWSRMGFDLGVGMNYTPAADLLAVVDFGFIYSGVKEKYTPIPAADTLGDQEWKYTNFTLPYMRLGFEGKVCKWLDVRAGGTATLWTDQWKYSSDFDTDYSFDDPSTSTYLGFGLNFGKLYLDGCMDPEMLLKGPEFISGSSDYYGNDNMNYEVSMIYELF